MDQENQPQVTDVRDLVRQVLNESDVILASKYTDEDAQALGLPTPGQMNLINKVAKQLEGTPFVPKWISQSPNPGGTLLAVMLRGRSLGFAPLACPDIFWQDPGGRLAMWGRNMLAVIYREADEVKFVEETDDICRVWAKRKNSKNEYESRFSHDDAVLAGLVDKNQSLHKKYPRRMLKWRAVSDLANTLFQDVFIGGIVTREEAEEDANLGLVNGDGSSQVFAGHARERASQFTVGEVIDVKPEQPEPAKDNVVEMPKTAQAPTAEPERKPAATAPAPTPAPAPVAPPKPAEPPKPAPAKLDNKADQLAARMQAIPELVKTSSPVAVGQRVSTWMKNFLNVKTLPKGPDHYLIYGRMLDIVEASLKADPSRIMDHPLESGLQCGVGYREFLKLVESWVWSDRCKESAFDLAVAYGYPYAGGSPTTTWAKDFEEFMIALQIPDLTEKEIWTFLRVGLRTRLGHMLVQTAGLTSTPMSKIVQAWGIDVETAPVEGIEAFLIGGLKKAEAENPDPDSEAPAAQTSPDPAPAETKGPGVKEEIQDILDMFS